MEVFVYPVPQEPYHQELVNVDAKIVESDQKQMEPNQDVIFANLVTSLMDLDNVNIVPKAQSQLIMVLKNALSVNVVQVPIFKEPIVIFVFQENFQLMVIVNHARLDKFPQDLDNALALIVELELKQMQLNQVVNFVNLVISLMDLVNVNLVLLDLFLLTMVLKHASDVDVVMNPMLNELIVFNVFLENFQLMEPDVNLVITTPYHLDMDNVVVLNVESELKQTQHSLGVLFVNLDFSPMDLELVNDVQ